MPHFSENAKPLLTMTEKDHPFVWGEAQAEAFTKLKDVLTHAPILAYPLAKGQFILDTDASNVGLGAVLSQIQNGEIYLDSLSLTLQSHGPTTPSLILYAELKQGMGDEGPYGETLSKTLLRNKPCPGSQLGKP